MTQTVLRQTTIHQPRLDTVVMIEKTVEKNSGEFGKFQLWRRLPKSVMYQTYLHVLSYLEHSNKIAFDKENKIAWIFQPKVYKKFIGRKDLGR
ncbi:MAG: hypothetical protein ABII01_05195 [Candidatus Woesearchaeota archaeon]